MWVATAAESREADRISIEKHGIASAELMRRAAAAAFRLAQIRFPSSRSILVLAGPGNNGGDGCLMAQLLTAAGKEVTLALVGRTVESLSSFWPDTATPAALSATVFEPTTPLPDLERYDLVVDGLFGTGLTRPLGGEFLRLVQALNAADTPVLALDVPSGMDSDTGAALGDVVRATATAMFMLPKRCAFTPGGAACGEVSVDSLGSPSSAGPTSARITAWVEQGVGPRDPWSHKGSHGHVLVLAGSRNYHGAAVLAALGALRGGAGLVTVASIPSVVASIRAQLPEVVCLELPEEDGVVAAHAAEAVRRVEADAVVVGPGLGQADRCLAEFIPHLCVPCCLDADALNAVSRGQPVPPGAVLTPHPGEAARLLGCTASEVEADRFGAVARLSSLHGCTVVLKGHRTLVASPGSPTGINPTGNPGMATGGVGDVLAGMIGTALAQGSEPAAAVLLHGAAGDLCAERIGPVGFTASELAAHIPAARAKLDQCSDEFAP